jgi:hypothetical protein
MYLLWKVEEESFLCRYLYIMQYFVNEIYHPLKKALSMNEFYHSCTLCWYWFMNILYLYIPRMENFSVYRLWDQIGCWGFLFMKSFWIIIIEKKYYKIWNIFFYQKKTTLNETVMTIALADPLAEWASSYHLIT